MLHSALPEAPFSSMQLALRRTLPLFFLRWLAAGVVFLLSGNARAQSSTTWPLEARSDGESPAEAWDGGMPRFIGPSLKGSPGWSFGVHGQAGLAVLSEGNRGIAHALVGGLARLQIGYFEIGGTIEQTDRVIESWRSYGAFVGAFLPFDRWVDVDCTLGAHLRRHKNPEPRFGPGGYALTSPGLSLGIGISDRSSEAEVGVRVGARLMAALDLRRQEATWRYQIVENDPTGFVSGTTPVGGFSLGAMLTAGFDIARATRGAEALTARR